MSIHWGGRGAGHVSRWSASTTGVPALVLDFLTTTSLDSRITFTRGSNATLVDSTGKITYAPANLFLRSEEFNDPAWTKSGVTVTANTDTAPDGTLTADKIVPVVASLGFKELQQGFAATIGVNYAFSCYVKEAGYRYIQLVGTGGQFGTYAINYDLQTGTETAFTAGTSTVVSKQITSAGNGWYRVSVVLTAIGTSASARIGINVIPADNSVRGVIWASDGTSGILQWGAQIEQVTYQTLPSTYTQTVATAYYGPRFDYDPATLAAKGLLIEEQRVNLFLRSEEFNDPAWTKGDATVTANATVSPDGTTNADKLVEAATTGTHFATQTPSFVSGTTYTTSVYIKAAERSVLAIQLRSVAFGTTRTAWFDTVTGTVTKATGVSTTTMTDAGNGWYRCTITATASVTATTNVYFYLDNSPTGTGSYTGNGTSGLFIWGAQLETGAFATSYIPTVASTVQRNTDVATMTGTNFSSWYNQNAGTMLCNFILEGQTVGGGVGDVWAIDLSGATNNAIRLRQGTIIAGADATMITGGVVQVDSNSFATPVNTRLKSAFAWSTASSNLTANGVSLGDGGAITPPTVNQFVLTGSNKWLRQISFYPSRLTNAQLQALTA